jgi:UDPglucose 6-dehydrogenase
MNITVIGTGYVGLVTGTCFAQMGNKVNCVDIDEAKIARLAEGLLPIFEPGLDALVEDNLAEGSLRFGTDLGAALSACQLVMIAVGTPMDEDGSADLRHVLQAARDIGRLMDHSLVIVTKSTVPVGTAALVREAVQSELDLRTAEEAGAFALHFHVVSNPEFLKEGSAVEDFMHPDRIIVGADHPEAVACLRSLYRPFLLNHDRMQVMDLASAEMTKYAANAMLATKISFMNEIAAICEQVGADVNKVRVGIGSDTRIGYSFLYAGAGYGGSCCPKDVRALIHSATSRGYAPRILQSVEAVNSDQKQVLFRKIRARFGGNLDGRRFAVWGLAFKPGTDDLREAPSLSLIRDITASGGIVQAYDPKAMKEARRRLAGNDRVEFADSKYEALKNADALVLVTEWKEFRSPDWDELAALLKERVIVDGRNQYDREQLARLGFEYHEIGYAGQPGQPAGRETAEPELAVPAAGRA